MQDVNDKLSIQYPRLYTPGHLDLFFNKKVFAQSVLEGFLTSLVLFFIPYGAYQDAIQSDGLDVSGHKAFGLVVASCLIVTVSLRVRMLLVLFLYVIVITMKHFCDCKFWCS